MKKVDKLKRINGRVYSMEVDAEGFNLEVADKCVLSHYYWDFDGNGKAKKDLEDFLKEVAFLKEAVYAAETWVLNKLEGLAYDKPVAKGFLAKKPAKE